MVRSAFHSAVAASLLFLCSPLLCAQSEPPQHPPRPKVVGPAKWNPAPQEVSVAYWTLEPGWSTVLEMRNNVTHHDLTVTPVLRASTGEETPLTPVLITPQHVVSLDLRNAAAASSKTLGPFGSVVFRFDGLYPDNLFAATIVRREGEPIDFHFDGQDNGPTYNSGGIEGVWWLPAASSTDYLILSNPLKKTVTGTLTLTSTFASHRPVAVSLGPGETKRINLGEVLGSSSIGAVGGLSLSLPGKELISATQIVFDEVTGLAAMMKMFDREPDDQPKSRVLLAPMMALSQPDQGLGFPNGTQLLPRIFLRNAGPAPSQVAISVDWRSETKSGEIALSPLALSQGEVKVINLADDQKSGQIPPDANWGTLKLAYTGRRADLVAVAVSYDKTNRYGLQTPFSEDLSRMWAGGMWHVDPTHNTFITTGNGGTEATTAEVTLFYNGGTSKYRIEKMLSPGQQLWLDVGHLVHDQIPDSDGHTLPPETMTGSYELRDLDHAYVGQLYEGKLVIDKTYGHAAYGCGSCCGYDGVVLDPSPFGGPPGIENDDYIYANDTCAGDQEDVTGDGYSWASSDTAVATLPNRTLHTVGVGSATGSTLVQLQRANPPHCLVTVFGPTQPLSVASLSCTASVTRGGSATCTVTGPSGTTVSGWKFTSGGDTVTRTTNTTSLTWSGAMVTGGTVNATANSSPTPLSYSITVNNRTGFAFTAVSPTAENNDFSADGCTISVASPPQQTGDAVGIFCLAQYFSFNTAQIGDNGPNNGYSYVTSISSKDTSNNYTAFFYVISPDLENTSSAFYKAQCGNYSSTAKTGFISGSNLLTDTTRHESGTVQSHYQNYLVAQDNSANNLGTVAEATTGLESAQTLANGLTTTLTGDRNTILSATQVQPCGVQYDASCNFQGCINFSPYHSCSEVVSCVP